jgi:hypothetical protein
VQWQPEAERRFADAEARCNTNDNARANGAAYLAGFVVEILLKARLVKRFPAVARKRQHELLESEQHLWRLIWRQHDLEAMVNRMKELEAGLKARGERDGCDYFAELKKVCASWTIQARYSSRQMRIGEARDWINRVRLLKELLK